MLYRHNNFDSLRFWAALAVVWSHAFPMVEGGRERNEPLFWLSGGQTTAGTLSVSIFFVISGYLITRSFERSESPWRFVLARVLRIMPALLVILLLCALVMGPLVSTLPAREYFSFSTPYRYIFTQATFSGWVDELPGVFTTLPSSFINGSLWTLRFEVECYALVFLLGISGLLKKHVTLALFIAAMLYLIVWPGQPGTADSVPVPNRHIELGCKFLAGALLYQWQVPLKGKVAAACAVVCVVSMLFGQYAVVSRCLLAYVVLYVSMGDSMVRLPNMSKWGDLSYGIYIYAWPVSQLVVLATGTTHWYVVAALASCFVLPISLASWHGIEKVALSYKQRRPQPSPAPTLVAVHE